MIQESLSSRHEFTEMSPYSHTVLLDFSSKRQNLSGQENNNIRLAWDLEGQLMKSPWKAIETKLNLNSLFKKLNTVDSTKKASPSRRKDSNNITDSFQYKANDLLEVSDSIITSYLPPPDDKILSNSEFRASHVVISDTTHLNKYENAGNKGVKKYRRKSDISSWSGGVSRFETRAAFLSYEYVKLQPKNFPICKLEGAGKGPAYSRKRFKTTLDPPKDLAKATSQRTFTTLKDRPSHLEKLQLFVPRREVLNIDTPRLSVNTNERSARSSKEKIELNPSIMNIKDEVISNQFHPTTSNSVAVRQSREPDNMQLGEKELPIVDFVSHKTPEVQTKKIVKKKKPQKSDRLRDKQLKPLPLNSLKQNMKKSLYSTRRIPDCFDNSKEKFTLIIPAEKLKFKCLEPRKRTLTLPDTTKSPIISPKINKVIINKVYCNHKISHFQNFSDYQIGFFKSEVIKKDKTEKNQGLLLSTAQNRKKSLGADNQRCHQLGNLNMPKSQRERIEHSSPYLVTEGNQSQRFPLFNQGNLQDSLLGMKERIPKSPRDYPNVTGYQSNNKYSLSIPKQALR